MEIPMNKINVLIFFSLIMTACTPRMYIIESSLGDSRIDRIIYNYSSNGNTFFQEMIKKEINYIYIEGGVNAVLHDLAKSKADCIYGKTVSCRIKAYKTIQGSGIIPTVGRVVYDIVINIIFNTKGINSISVSLKSSSS
jgi:hypothetical protein